MADQPWHQLPPEIAAVAPALRELADAMIEEVARCRPTRDRSRVSSGRASGAGWRRRCGTSWPRSRPQARSPAPTCTGARAGRDARGRSLESLLSAYRAGARVAWRRFATPAWQPASSPRPCICWRSRSSPTSTSCRPSRPRAMRSSSRDRGRGRAPAPALVRLLVREPPADPERSQAAAGGGGMGAAAVARGDRDRGRAAATSASCAATRRTRSPRRSASSSCAIVPDPTAPGAARARGER